MEFGWRRSVELLPSNSDTVPSDGSVSLVWLGPPVLRFSGGTNDIQRRIIAMRGLGLPR